MVFECFGREIHIKKELLVSGIVLLIIAAALVGFVMVNAEKQVVIEKKEQERANQNNTETAAKDMLTGGAAEAKQQEEIKVYLVGCVKTPGIVSIRKEQIIYDAIQAAGGTTESADLENINLVYKLRDNVMLRIKQKNDVQLPVSPAVSPAPGQMDAGKGIDIIRDSGGVVVNDNGTGGKTGGKIGINSATADELDTLPGIGKETAKQIIAFREKNGRYKKISDVMKIPGIKQSKFEKIKDHISVD